MDAIATRAFSLNGRDIEKEDSLELPIEQFRDLRAAGLVEAANAPKPAPAPEPKPKAPKAG